MRAYTPVCGDKIILQGNTPIISPVISALTIWPYQRQADGEGRSAGRTRRTAGEPRKVGKKGMSTTINSLADLALLKPGDLVVVAGNTPILSAAFRFFQRMLVGKDSPTAQDSHIAIVGKIPCSRSCGNPPVCGLPDLVEEDWNGVNADSIVTELASVPIRVYRYRALTDAQAQALMAGIYDAVADRTADHWYGYVPILLDEEACITRSYWLLQTVGALPTKQCAQFGAWAYMRYVTGADNVFGFPWEDALPATVDAWCMVHPEVWDLVLDSLATPKAAIVGEGAARLLGLTVRA